MLELIFLFFPDIEKSPSLLALTYPLLQSIGLTTLGLQTGKLAGTVEQAEDYNLGKKEKNPACKARCTTLH